MFWCLWLPSFQTHPPPVPSVRTAAFLSEQSQGGGGDSSKKNTPICVCWGSENVPILKDHLCKKKTIPY